MSKSIDKQQDTEKHLQVKLPIGGVSKRTYNEDELRHIAVNYAIHCLKGYEGSFTDWFNRISKDWRKIANRKQ